MDFKEFYKKHIFKESGGQRLTQIDFLINDVIAEMQSIVDPTKWNELLQRKEELEIEREIVAAQFGEFKMQ